MNVINFVGKRGNYQFYNQWTEFDDNFGEVVPRTTRNYGVDGGIDEYGDSAAPQAIGNVRMAWWIFADGGRIAAREQETIGLAGWGRHKLFARVNDDRAGKRYAMGRINNINMPKTAKGQAHVRLKVTANFQMAQPFWQGSVSEPIQMDENFAMDEGFHMDGAIYMDEGLTMDSGLLIGAAKLEKQMKSGDTATITHWGDHPVRAKVVIGGIQSGWTIGHGVIIGFEDPPLYMGTATAPVQDITLTARHGGRDQSQFRYPARLEAGEWIEVDGNRQRVTKHSDEGIVSGYGAWQHTKGGGWVTLYPGENEIEVTGNFTNRYCYVAVWADDAWY